MPGPLLLILFMGVQGRYFGRWLMPALPELAILAALAAVKLGELVGRSERSRAVLICGFAVLLVAQGLERSVHADRVLARDDTRNLTRQWMVDNIPAGSKVVVEPVVPDAWFTDPGVPRADFAIRQALGQVADRQVDRQRQGAAAARQRGPRGQARGLRAHVAPGTAARSTRAPATAGS